MVEPGGRIVWYGMQGAKMIMDMSDSGEISGLVQRTVESLLEERS